jgi:hypothetical protein
VAFLITGAYWFAGYALAKLRKIGAVTAIVTCVVMALPVATPVDIAGIAIVTLNVIIIALVVVGWRHLSKPRNNGVGA